MSQLPLSQARFWSAGSRGRFFPVALGEGLGLSPSGEITPLDSGVAAKDLPLLILPAPDESGTCAVALVSEICDQPISRNGVSLSAGIHLLASKDRMNLGERTFWVSAFASPEETVYDPAVHGEDVFCFRTKARLTRGAAIVICPCKMIYKASAWATGVACHNCHFDPSQPAWEPPAPRERNSLDAFLAL